MTLDQINLYSTAIAKKDTLLRVNTIANARVAQHADESGYKKIMGDLQRELSK